MSVNLEASWLAHLGQEFDKPYMRQIKDYLLNQKKLGIRVYPTGSQIFNALNITPFDIVKVVILGQDPYHGLGQANGLSFSVNPGIKFPPSLQNIFKELEQDISGFIYPQSGDLTSWAKQGVLLLNATLTVAANTPGSHQKIGWEDFTNHIIQTLSNEKENLVFILWGKFAQAKDVYINNKKHLIIKSAHPSPFSAHHGFLGSKPFSKANEYLKSREISEIDWRLT